VAKALKPIIKAIGDWGMPLLADTADSDVFQIHWLVLPCAATSRTRRPSVGRSGSDWTQSSSRSCSKSQTATSPPRSADEDHELAGTYGQRDVVDHAGLTVECLRDTLDRDLCHC
jgi:hypothetical protein